MDCRRQYNQENYQANRERILERTALRNAATRRANQEYAWAYLLGHPCACGQSDLRCLQFDHDDRENKVTDVSVMIGRWSTKAVMAEIAKCTVRCANCHAIRTYEQLGWELPPRSPLVQRQHG